MDLRLSAKCRFRGGQTAELRGHGLSTIQGTFPTKAGATASFAGGRSTAPASPWLSPAAYPGGHGARLLASLEPPTLPRGRESDPNPPAMIGRYRATQSNIGVLPEDFW
jgi:hypothetical protein